MNHSARTARPRALDVTAAPGLQPRGTTAAGGAPAPELLDDLRACLHGLHTVDGRTGGR
ncbi:hypothetical protein [Streptomyces canus]|uniref:hypothetical protein n=1 Tax=Streptomyces canus TaxID=58343 RepID=UPI0036EA9688